MTRRAALLLAVLALPAAGVTACGGDEPERAAERPAAQAPAAGAGDAARALREATARTLRAGTAQASYRVTATPGGLLLTADGPSELRRRNARLRVRTTAQGGPGPEVQVHLAGERSFVELPGVGWRAAPAEATGFSTGLDALSWLGGVTDDVREVAPRRFRAVVDLGRVAGELPRDERSRYREELRRRFRATELPAEVLLDAQGNVTRFRVDLPASALREAPGGGVQGLRIEVGLTRFGIAVPPAPRDAAPLGETDPS
jgi:hypothetical protein